MTIEDFFQEIEDEKIDFSLGAFIVFFKRKRLFVSRVEWSQIDNNNSLKIFLCVEKQSQKSIIQILQDLELIRDSIKKFEQVKRKIKSNIYIQFQEKEKLIKKIKSRKGNLFLE